MKIEVNGQVTVGIGVSRTMGKGVVSKNEKMGEERKVGG